MIKYCVDTNIIIDLWNEDRGAYPKDVFCSLWDKFNELIHTGILVSVKDVYEELKNEKDQDLKSWLGVNREIFLDITDSLTITKLKEILHKYPMFGEGHASGADPVLVSHAACCNLILISSEKPQVNPSPKIPKIPNLCREFDVTCFNIVDFCREENIKL